MCSYAKNKEQIAISQKQMQNLLNTISSSDQESPALSQRQNAT